MAITAATPLTLAKSLLNDATGTNYTTAALLPLMQKAYRELQVKVSKAGLSPNKEVSAELTLLAGTTELADGAGLPVDFLLPVAVFERGTTSEGWQEVYDRTWEPNVEMGTSLGVYAWREEAIKFIGSTTDRLLLLRYLKSFTPITSDSTAILIPDADLFLASRTGAIAALVIGENPTRATALNADAEMQWNDWKGTRVKRDQGRPVRRKTTRFRQ